ncbi:MAG: recombinase family protein [Deltaproteobacteria bacterium]
MGRKWTHRRSQSHTGRAYKPSCALRLAGRRGRRSLGQGQRILSRILQLRECGLSIRAIADTLNEKGLPARGKRWHATTVARILAAHAIPAA